MHPRSAGMEGVTAPSAAAVEPPQVPEQVGAIESADYWRGRWEEASRMDGKLQELARTTLWQAMGMQQRALIWGLRPA